MKLKRRVKKRRIRIVSHRYVLEFITDFCHVDNFPSWPNCFKNDGSASSDPNDPVSSPNRISPHAKQNVQKSKYGVASRHLERKSDKIMTFVFVGSRSLGGMESLSQEGQRNKGIRCGSR